MAVVRPSAAWNDPEDALNHRLQNIHWAGVNARQTLGRLTSVGFDAPVTALPGLYALENVNPSTFAVDIADGTVIQVLNAAASRRPVLVDADREDAVWLASGDGGPGKLRRRRTLGHLATADTGGQVDTGHR